MVGVLIAACAATFASPTAAAAEPLRPNVLLAIADDQSFPHTSAAGYKAVNTPAFDRVAREGVLFANGFAGSPGCSPSRAALLTGRHPWMLEHAGTHASEFPTKYPVYPDLLEKAGYHVGFTGKGWGPGDWQVSGRDRNPAGPAYQKRNLTPPYKGISTSDYAANFQDFLAKRKPGQPFCFWYGATEPHRGYEKGSGLKAGKKLADAAVPPFLPDAPAVRSDLLDYCVEIEWFDRHLGRMLKALEDAGELDNTLVIVTADNGMSFPRAKANCYEYGIHVPLAVRWPGAGGKAGRRVIDPVGFVDLTATILDAAGVKPEGRIEGKSLRNILASAKDGTVDPARDAVYASRERHSSARYDNLGYPQRCVRTRQYLYVRNFKPDRWPAGDPRVYDTNGKLGPEHSGYADIDAGPTLKYLTEHHADPAVARFLALAVAKRPAEELFDVVADPGCLTNLAGDPKHAAARTELADRLDRYLRETGDPRATGTGDVWETYKRYSPIRKFPPPDGGR
jgi:uncharacterized sulfatase